MEDKNFEVQQQYYLAKTEKFKNAQTISKLSKSEKCPCRIQNASTEKQIRLRQ